jgi:hypothetical protein
MNVGERIQMHPATDHWMRGDRYGFVSAVARRASKSKEAAYWVRLDKSNRLVKVTESLLTAA